MRHSPVYSNLRLGKALEHCAVLGELIPERKNRQKSTISVPGPYRAAPPRLRLNLLHGRDMESGIRNWFESVRTGVLDHKAKKRALREARTAASVGSAHHGRNYRARKFNAEGEFSRQEWADLCVKYNHRCAYCGNKTKLTADHIIPLSRGGSNFITNIRPACRSCNSKKGNRV